MKSEPYHHSVTVNSTRSPLRRLRKGSGKLEEASSTFSKYLELVPAEKRNDFRCCVYGRYGRLSNRSVRRRDHLVPSHFLNQLNACLGMVLASSREIR